MIIGKFGEIIIFSAEIKQYGSILILVDTGTHF